MGDNDAEVDCVNLWQLHGVEWVSDSRIATTRIDKTDETDEATQRRIDEWQNQQLYKLELQSVRSVSQSVSQWVPLASRQPWCKPNQLKQCYRVIDREEGSRYRGRGDVQGVRDDVGKPRIILLGRFWSIRREKSLAYKIISRYLKCTQARSSSAHTTHTHTQTHMRHKATATTTINVSCSYKLAATASETELNWNWEK